MLRMIYKHIVPKGLILSIRGSLKFIHGKEKSLSNELFSHCLVIYSERV